MSHSEEAKDNANRLRQAEKIVHHPEQYKVCEGCGSIVVTRAVSCPSCHGYRFDTSTTRIVSQAQALAMRNPSSVLASDLT
jgi:ribosomal protein L40E